MGDRLILTDEDFIVDLKIPSSSYKEPRTTVSGSGSISQRPWKEKTNPLWSGVKMLWIGKSGHHKLKILLKNNTGSPGSILSSA